MRGERSDTEVTCIPKDIQHCSGRSGKGGPTGSVWTPRETPRVWLVIRQEQHLFICM